MNSLVIVNGTDITPWIVPGSYSMKVENLFESWLDGNYVEHRVYTRAHMVGSFKVWMAEVRGMDLDDFITIWDGATNNHITTMVVYDSTTNSMKAINAYCSITPDEHQQLANDKYYDVLNIEVTER